jgi:hypothetical protein
MLTMLPESHGIHFPSHEPTFQNWKPAKITVTYGEYFTVVTEVLRRLVKDADTDVSRWVKLIEQVSNLTPADRGIVLDALRQRFADDEFSASEKPMLWESLRAVTSRHREYSDAEWALPPEELEKIDQVQTLLKPDSPSDRHAWLFQEWTPPLQGHSIGSDYQAYEAALAASRKDAVSEIDRSEGYSALLHLAHEATQAWWVGIAIADATAAKYERELVSFLGSDDSVDSELGASYVARRFKHEGWPWLEQLPERTPSLTTAQRAILLLQTSDYPKSWQRADELGEETARAFWIRFRIYGLGGFTNTAYAAERLMRVGRNAAALQLIEIYIKREGSDVKQLLEHAASALEALLQTDDLEVGTLRQYDFVRLFDLFYEHEAVLGWERIAHLEWQYLPALGFDANPKMLGRLLARDPNFFVEVVSVVFRPASAEDAPQVTEEGQRKAANAYRLLDGWTMAPGTQDDGYVDAAVLSEWVSQAMRGLQEADRLDAGTRAIGRVLARASSDPDGSWPCRAIRDLFEEQHSDQLEAGFDIGTFNERGVTSRSLDAGGAQERSLAAKYREDAKQCEDQWPRTAALLRSLADQYERDARGEDNSAERFRRGLE